jgi:hypothetical protein
VRSTFPGAALSGRTPERIGRGAMTYQLRRLRLPAMIERIPHSHPIASPTPVSEPPCYSPEPIIAFCAPLWPPSYPIITPPLPCSSDPSTLSIGASPQGSPKTNLACQT